MTTFPLCFAYLSGPKHMCIPEPVSGVQLWVSETKGGAPIHATVMARISAEGTAQLSKRFVNEYVKKSTAWLVVVRRGQVIASGPVMFPEMTL